MKARQGFLIQLIFYSIVFTVVGCADSDQGNRRQNNNNVVVDEVVIDELERLSVLTTGDAEVQEISLPGELSDANWAIKAMVCEDGGYDLLPFAGQTLKFTAIDIEGSCEDERIKIWVVTEPSYIVCAYLTVQENSDLAPGVWSIADENCSF